MRTHIWAELGEAIPVASAFRDLGAQASTVARMGANALKARVVATGAVLERVAHFPGPADLRVKLVLGKGLPKALYGCETTP
eukprot:12331529-Alexandrium_andersonii.AAC.1